MAEVGAAWQNSYAERLIRTIKDEEVDLSEYLDYHDAYRQLGRFLDDVYMHKRIHSSPGYLKASNLRESVQVDAIREYGTINGSGLALPPDLHGQMPIL